MERISRLWRRDKQPEPEPKPQKKALPKNFAEELLNAQLELQSSPQVDLVSVNRLVELYSIAVEYYESIQSSKYLIFKQKITQLLLNPMVSQTIDDSSAKKEQQLRTQRGQEPIIQSSAAFDKRREIEHNLTYALRNTEGDVRYMIINANDRRDNLSKMIASGLLEQELSIRKRLKNRKKNLKTGSRDSTEGDSREQRLDWEDNREQNETNLSSRPCTIVEEDLEESIISQPDHPTEIEQSSSLPTEHTQNQNILGDLSPTQSISAKKPDYTEYLLSPEEILRRRQKLMKRSRRKLLTLANNTSSQQLPGQYNIPF